MGRRWGKTVLGGCISLSVAAAGGKVAWIVPAYRNGRPLWRWAEQATDDLRKARKVQSNKAERVMEFPNGGFLGIYSMDNPDSIRGEWFHLAILDEAAMIAEEAWTDAIQPTLADAGGDAILISTPKGRNWFWREWTRGAIKNSDYASWTAPTRDNPNPRIQRAFDLVKDRVPERTYRQEWCAEFVEDGGILRRISEAATAEPQTAALAGHQYVLGVDWGKLDDFTVITVLDTTTREMVAMDRFNQIDYAYQIKRVKDLYNAFRPRVVVAERNSMGEPLIDSMRREKMRVQPFVTTNQSKADAIDDLSLAFEKSDLKILNDPILIAELQGFEATRLPSGALKYGAPEGTHDDCVMSLALAYTRLGRARGEKSQVSSVPKVQPVATPADPPKRRGAILVGKRA